MRFEKAVELTADLDAFMKFVDEHSLNGIVGDIKNYHALDADLMFNRMVDLARLDVQQLTDGITVKDAGQSLW